MLLLPLDNRFALAERQLHLSPLRHILLGLLYLLLSGGGQAALAFEDARGSQATGAEYVAGQTAGPALEATLPQERAPNGRAGEGRTTSTFPILSRADPYVPPGLSAALNAAVEIRPAFGAAEFPSTFARAPPLCP